MSNFQKGMLTKEWAETHWGEFKVKEPNVSKATQAADKFVEDVNERDYSASEIQKDTDKPSNQRSSPLPRGSEEQSSLNSPHNNVPSTAAAALLGMENIANAPKEVKDAIEILEKIYLSVQQGRPLKKRTTSPVDGGSLLGNLKAMEFFTKQDDKESAYWQHHGRTLRMSKHFMHADNFNTTGENLSVAIIVPRQRESL